MADLKYVQLQKKVEGVIYDLAPRTRTINVYLDDGTTTLTEYLATLATKVSLEEDYEAAKAYTDKAIADLINGAPETLDTLKEIADWIENHHGEYEALVGEVQNLAAGKVDKVDGKELSANDFTDELLAKLNAIEAEANNYVHPDTHSAEMITETTDRQFVDATEKKKIAESGRILIGLTVPASLTEEDLFLQVL